MDSAQFKTDEFRMLVMKAGYPFAAGAPRGSESATKQGVCERCKESAAGVLFCVLCKLAMQRYFFSQRVLTDKLVCCAAGPTLLQTFLP